MQTQTKAKRSKLEVIVKAEKLIEYIAVVTTSSPKRFRFSLVARMYEYSMNSLENMHRANNIYVSMGDKRAAYERISYMKKAMTDLDMLASISKIAMDVGCILSKQYIQITKQIYETQHLIGGWIRSDRRRFEI